jgi:hypothetical protein
MAFGSSSSQASVGALFLFAECSGIQEGDRQFTLPALLTLKSDYHRYPTQKPLIEGPPPLVSEAPLRLVREGSDD